MRVVVQRVLESSVLIDEKEKRNIDKGLMLLVSFTYNDTIEDIDYMINKVSNLRIFDDDNGNMNLSVKDINGEILLISQFTLYADSKKGNRPSFNKCLKYELAKPLYDEFVNRFKNNYKNIKTGEFGSDMKVSLINDGPVTIIIDTKEEL